jgi:probable HAF family extracellular repeat protein
VATTLRRWGSTFWGNVVGYSVPHAFLWTPFEGMQDLGNLPGGYYSQALAINSRDEVVGFSNAKDGNWHGFVWTRSKGMEALPYLFPGDNSASANGINQEGRIVGGVAQDYHGMYAVQWDRDGRVANLGVLPGQRWSTAFAINDRGQVVGWSGFRAFIWSRSEGIQDLNNLIPHDSGWFLSLPTAINRRGQITGQGTIKGQSHAFLLTPVSQPVWACN